MQSKSCRDEKEDGETGRCVMTHELSCMIIPFAKDPSQSHEISN